MTQYLSNLNDPQKEAVLHTEGPLLVLAGAGTGKTMVITARIAHLLASNLALPHQILATTFTNKAANEMRERISRMSGESLYWLGTFHSISARILREHGHVIGLTRSFSILDADDQEKLIKQIATELAVDVKKFTPKVLCGTIQLWKDAYKTPDNLFEKDLQSDREKTALKVYRLYQQRLIAMDTTDFGDLLLHNISIFMSNPEIAERYRSLFKYIMVDEYQDTNSAQHQWLAQLTGPSSNLCCVGDDDQSIYSWRGAQVGNILNFRSNFPDAHVIRLEQNYRSGKSILSAAAALISQNKLRHDKTVWTDRSLDRRIVVKACRTDLDESNFIAARIRGILHEHSGQSVAVLVRALFQTRLVEEALSKLLIPYRVVGSLKFYERQEVKDVLAYLRLVTKENDDLAFERIVNRPARGIGDTSIDKIRDFARSRDCSMFRASELIVGEGGLLPPQATSRLRIFVQMVKSWRESACDKSALVTRIVEESGYLAMLKEDKDEASRTRVESVRELIRAIDSFESVAEFLEHVALVSEVDTSKDASVQVTIMTLHAAKGLEFNCVFLPGWEEELFPHARSINEVGGMEEERRLAYVGITRAKQELYISYASNRKVYNQWLCSAPSRFLKEIPRDCYVLQ